MDAFSSSHPSDATLGKLNSVQLNLGVITLADITNNAGTEIKPWALTGEMRACPTIEWPIQEKPADMCFIMWCRFLKNTSALMPNKLIASISLYVSAPLLDPGSPIHLTLQDHFTTAPHPILSFIMYMGPS
eukprot:11307668-Ditylum_brightwellii.AAC.1